MTHAVSIMTWRLGPVVEFMSASTVEVIRLSLDRGARMGELLYGPALWSRIREKAAAVNSRKAAVAYVGKNADELIAFSSGDTVVVDGSDNALRAGSTNPETLSRWYKAGAEIYSYEGLHAKVLVLGHTVVVGSANVSWHSHDRLLEAAVVDTTTALRRSAVVMIDELVASSLEPVDEIWLKAARALYHPSKGPIPGTGPGGVGQPLLPPGQFRLMLGHSWADEGLSAQDARQDEKARALLSRQIGPVKKYALERWVRSRSEAAVRPGDVWVLVSFDKKNQPGAVSSPARVLRTLPLSGKTTATYLRYDRTLDDVTLDAAQKAVRKGGGRWSYDKNIVAPDARAALLGLWGVVE
jgi:hypothetical protein